MRGQDNREASKHINIGLLAPVDAGKTTLSEAMLYLCGNIRKAGRVDNGDTFFDTNELERARGITIFSRQAILHWKETQITLLDTPGHVDFSAEMERTLQILDYAVLVVSGADGVQGHTRTLWSLLKKYGIPVFFFVNKMDQPGTKKEAVLSELKKKLSADCVDFTDAGTEAFYENVATCDEEVLERYLEQGSIQKQEIGRLIYERKLFPCYFGSALKMDGVEKFLEGFCSYTREKTYPAEFGARVFKIARDEQGKRLTFLKVTGGSLLVRQILHGERNVPGRDKSNRWEEKINQIRIYSGEKYETAEEVRAGDVCAVLGLHETYPGEGLGAESALFSPVLEPALSYCIYLPEGIDVPKALPMLRQLEEEEPELHIVWNEELQEIHAKLMGEVQMEILKSLIAERFGMEVSFGAGNIIYKETICNRVEGVGHFEPLRHYAEVHLMLEPLDAGCGLQFAAACSEDVLSRNWQRLILTHLEEKEHLGVLTGSPLTDVRITLVAGRAHQKHTEGGDFRQATYRAVRQGLMQAQSVLLEPYYNFTLELPEYAVGRAMTDVERMYGKIAFDGGQGAEPDGSMRVLTGRAPVSMMQDYQREVTAYTKGHGRLTCTLGGYQPCHNAQEVIARIGYDPQRDVQNSPDSVFCAHGAGFVVEWDRVFEYMHLESVFSGKQNSGSEWKLSEEAYGAETGKRRKADAPEEAWIGIEEIDQILERTFHANKRDKSVSTKTGWKLKSRSRDRENVPAVTRTYRPRQKQEEYLLVDGYNIIFAWEELRHLAKDNIDGARGRLLDVMCNYQGIRGCELIVVFDAYRIEGHKTELFDYQNIHVVYTKEAETADQYIEKFAHENGKKYHVIVATSDGLEQIIIRGAGCELLSARDLWQEVTRKNVQMQEYCRSSAGQGRSFLLDAVAQDKIKIEE